MASPSDIGNPILRIPDLNLAQFKFNFLNGSTPEIRDSAKSKLWEAINTNDMAPLYSQLCEEASLPIDTVLLTKMQETNQSQLSELEAVLNTAQLSEGETEISDALINKANYLAKIGEKDKSIAAFRLAYEKTPGIGAKIDLVLTQFRVGLFHNDRVLILQQLDKAKSLIEQGGDWDRRNRCKVYEAVFLMSQRDFEPAAHLFLETLATFTSTELMDMKDFITYTVLMSVISLPRVEIKSKLLETPEILEVVHQVPHLETYMQSLYECRYNQFFTSIAHMEQLLKTNIYLNAHYPYYVREMRIRSYAQLLESYRSLTLEYMAAAFGVSAEFMDADLCRFIAAGRLNCVIDKVRGIVETNRPDHKNAQYQCIIKQGDLLLNRVQKLSRVINI